MFDPNECPKREPRIWIDPNRNWEKTVEGRGFPYDGCTLSLLGPPAGDCVYGQFQTEGECRRLTDKFFKSRKEMKT